MAASRSPHYKDTQMVRSAQDLMTILTILCEREVLSPWDTHGECYRYYRPQSSPNVF